MLVFQLPRTRGKLQDSVSSRDILIRFDAGNRTGAVFDVGGEEIRRRNTQDHRLLVRLAGISSRYRSVYGTVNPGPVQNACSLHSDSQRVLTILQDPSGCRQEVP